MTATSLNLLRAQGSNAHTNLSVRKRQQHKWCRVVHNGLVFLGKSTENHGSNIEIPNLSDDSNNIKNIVNINGLVLLGKLTGKPGFDRGIYQEVV